MATTLALIFVDKFVLERACKLILGFLLFDRINLELNELLLLCFIRLVFDSVKDW